MSDQLSAGVDPGVHGAFVLVRRHGIHNTTRQPTCTVVSAICFDEYECPHCGGTDWPKIEREIGAELKAHGVRRVSLEAAIQAGVPNRQRMAGIIRRAGGEVVNAPLIGAKAWWRTGRLRFDSDPKINSLKTCEHMAIEWAPVSKGKPHDGLADGFCLARWGLL